MTTIFDREALWRQLGAALDVLGDAIRDCPEKYWQTQLWPDEADQWVARGFSSYWYLCYHTLFWLDLYLYGTEDGFAPPAPFDLVEMHDNETLPRVYTKTELLEYHAYCRAKCQTVIASLSPEAAQRVCRFGWGELSYAELQLYSMRHVQEHAAQLCMFLGNHGRASSDWIPHAR
jgi:hypothetical protein